MTSVTGLHHITAIAGDPQENLDFYTKVLGMRLVKRSINQDVPDTYHLFFADGAGNPGTDLTFFPWPSLGPKQRGTGSWDEVYLTIPPGTAGYWEDRLHAHGIPLKDSQERFGETTLPFCDPHGLDIALIESSPYEDQPYQVWDRSPVPADRQIRGLGGARLVEHDGTMTARFLEQALGFARGDSEGDWQRYHVGNGAAGQRIDVRIQPESGRGQWGVGAIHHVAWRVPDGATQETLQRQIVSTGRTPTHVIDRFWFKSVYVNEPGGALFEVATDGPGFAVDEDPQHLGESLVLPEWYEPQREAIEAALPDLEFQPVRT